jgi:hypothetical protein
MLKNEEANSTAIFRCMMLIFTTKKGRISAFRSKKQNDFFCPKNFQKKQLIIQKDLNSANQMGYYH